MPKVVTTNWPEEAPRDVSAGEAEDLRVQGLLVPGKGDIDQDGFVKTKAAEKKKES